MLWHCCFMHIFFRLSVNGNLVGSDNETLIINSYVTEEVSHGLSIVDSTDSFREDQTDINCLYLGTLQLLDFMRNCISDHHLTKYGKEKILEIWLKHQIRHKLI